MNVRHLRFTLPALLALIAACAHTAQPPLSTRASTIEETSMLTILTSDTPETQLMALVLTKAAFDKGETPRILLCSDAGDLALKAPPVEATTPLAPKGMSPQGLLKALMTSGVKVEVCAIYLPNRPFGPEALLDGITVAMPPDIAEEFTKPGETVLSF